MAKEIIQNVVRYFSINERHELIKIYLSSSSSKAETWKKYTGQKD